LSEVLAHGRLHEIAVALQDMTADDFMKLPAGQRTLIRDALQSAASAARADAYSVIEEELLAFMERAQLGGMPAYLLHECRGVLQALLANPACNAGAKKLAEFLRRVNREQSERA
jgi:hypothetical protein